MNLTKDGFDRMVDTILSHHTSESPRSLAKMSVWQNASSSNHELRALLGDPWLTRRDDAEERAAPAAAAIDPAMSFFPTDWSNCLTEETMAELILDAYTSAFCDAFLDGAVSLVEVSNKWQATQSGSLSGLKQSQSESSLLQPKANRRLRNTSTTDKALLDMGLSDETPGASAGFTMSGLSSDPFEAWNCRNFHKCKPLDPFVKRIAKATETQRPARRIVKKPGESPDLRRFVYPMAATNFPRAWDKSSPPARTLSAAELAEIDEDAPASKWLLRIDKTGKTNFPYSLVSHRAFLDSQPDPVLKEKARKLAPLRYTDSW